MNEPLTEEDVARWHSMRDRDLITSAESELLATIDALRAERDALHTELDRVRHERGAQAVRLRACDVRIEDVTAERDAAVQRAEEAERGQFIAEECLRDRCENRMDGEDVMRERDALAVQVVALRDALAFTANAETRDAQARRAAALALDLPAAAKLAEARAKVCEAARELSNAIAEVGPEHVTEYFGAFEDALRALDALEAKP